MPTALFSPSAEGTMDFTWLFLKMMFALLVVCLAAVFVIKFLLPRASFVKRAADSQIEILERFTLEPKKNLYILKVAEKVVVVGTTENSISSLLELNAKDYRESSKKED